jgi:hypothetical protein
VPTHRRTTPPPGPRPPSRPDRDLYIRRIAYGYALINIGSGASYLLGGPASSPSLRALTETLPIEIYGAALLTTGVLAALKLYVPAYILGVLAWAAFALSAWLSFIDGTLTGASGPWTTTGLAYLHFLALRWRNQDRRAAP